MAESTARRRLDQPRAGGRSVVLQQLTVNGEWFAQLAERLARFLGTGTYLLWQTVIVLIWIALNVTGIVYRWDPYPFIVLNLAFSTQAAYAAPLILLAQNRQDDRDRIALEEDRGRASRTSADTEYLARELAALRLSVGELVTRDYLRGELERSGASDVSGSDRATRKMIEKAVEKAVVRALERTVDGAVDRAVDRAVDAAMTRAVDDVVDRAVDQAVNHSVDQAVDQAVERAVDQALNGAGPGTDES